MWKSALIIFLAVFLLTVCVRVNAASNVLINEFVSNVESDQKEWVEFYNSNPTDQSLAGWFIEERTGADLSSISSYPLDSITVPAQGFAVYEFVGSKLNNDGDILTLKNGSVEVDKVAYGSAANSQVDAPNKGQSAGRKTDGSSEWIIFESPSRGVSNNSGQPLISPTPTSTPTPTPSPTSTTTASSTPTPSPKATPKSSPAATRSASPSASPQVLGEQNRPLIASDAGLLDAGSPASTAFQGAPSKKVAGILIVSGATLVLFALGFHLWYRKINKGKLLETKDPFQL